ncbi:hypothetical protein DZJ_46640 [Dickeya ananatis]
MPGAPPSALTAQPRIIGDGGQAGSACGVARFQNGVFDKGQTGFFGGIDAQRGLCHHVETKIRQ